MKVFSVPDGLPTLEVDYYNYDAKKADQAIDRHKKALEEWLRVHGYSGPLTGKIYSEHVADGYAQYMYADKGAKSVLIHLPYYDAYQSLNVQHVPRKVVIERIQAAERIDALFAARKASA